MKKGVSNEERDKALKEMFGSEIEQTVILSDAQPIKRNEVVATSKRIAPNGTDAHTSPEERNGATEFPTAAPITPDASEMVASPDEYGRAANSTPDRGNKIPGRNIIPTADDETTERSEDAVPTESDEQTLPNGDDKFSEHTSPTQQSDQPVSSTCGEETRLIAESDPIRRTVKQRKSDLNEYRATFLTVPRIKDRKPVFVSGEVRDKIDRIVRLLGERGMSVSGLVENIALHHLATHEADIEHWRKM